MLESLNTLHIFKQLEERGYGAILLARYPSLRKYFADFVHLPFEAKPGSEFLLRAIHLIRQMDTPTLKKLPEDASTHFIPKELRCLLKDKEGKLQRNVWEFGLAIAMKESLRSGDLYLPKSKQHVSFWDLMLNEKRWQETREASYTELQKPFQDTIKSTLVLQFHQSVSEAEKRFGLDNFSEIKEGSLRLKKDDMNLLPFSRHIEERRRL